MKAGQALRALLTFCVALPLLAGTALGVLAWRLSHAPLESDLLARQIERAANAAGGPLTLSIGRAFLAWGGFRGEGAPLEIRVTGARLRDAAGQTVALLPDAEVTLALRPLLRGVLAPATVELLGPTLHLKRDAAGALALDAPGAAAPPGGAPAGPEADGAGLLLVLADLMRPAEERAAHTALRRVRLIAGQLTLRDERLDIAWALSDARLTLQRRPGGGVEAQGEAVLRALPAEGEAMVVPVHLSGGAAGSPARLTLRLDLPVLRPPELARLLPPLAPLALLDAPLAVQARFAFDEAGRALGAGLAFQATEEGRLQPHRGFAIRFAALEAELSGSAERLVLERARIELPGAAGTALEAAGELSLGPEGWAGPLHLLLSEADLPALPALWPPELAPEAREQARLALIAGRVEEARLSLDLRAGPDLAGWEVAGGRGALRLRQARLAPPGLSPVALDSAELSARLGAEEGVLEALRLVLPAPASGAPAPMIVAAGGLRRGPEGWGGSLDLALDRTRFQDLPVLWPQGLGEGARRWITENITEGEISEGRWRFTLGPGEGGAGLRLVGLEGELAATGASVHFLRPMPPVTGVAARARFSLDEVSVATLGGLLSLGGPPIRAREAALRFLFRPAGEPDLAEMSFQLAGPLVELAAALRHPRLGLFERRPFPVEVAAGGFEGRLLLGFPLLDRLSMDEVRLRAEARAQGVRLARLLFERDLEEAQMEVVADTEQLRLAGTGSLAGIAARYGADLDFRPGPAAQVVFRHTASLRAEAQQLAGLGLDAGELLRGPLGIETRGEQRRNGQHQVAIRADLRAAAMAFPPLGWSKAPGQPASAEASLRLIGEQVTSLESVRIEAPDLALRGRIAARAGRIERVELQESTLAGSRFAGDARAGARPGEPWAVTLRGPVLDLRAAMAAPREAERGAERGAGGAARQPPLALDLRFDRVLLGPGRELFALQARARLDEAGVLREAGLRGRTARAAGGFDLAITPAAGERRGLRGTAEDGGALLRAFGLTESIQGGRLSLSGEFAHPRPGAPLSGTAELEGFAVRNAPALGKLLQAITVFGVFDAIQGGAGLAFTRAVVPFTLTPDLLRVQEARAFSPSLGLTVQGRLQRDSNTLDMEGTIVPAYVVNTLLGNLPVIGRLFSPERGGGLFAAAFRVRGPVDDPEVTVNPLSALTPGFLRGIFGLGQ
ncbi:MAG: hypothetical protein N3D18_07245 [Roseococcus sp.]|nr:hypothetical protein [Roseococcus sp.]